MKLFFDTEFTGLHKDTTLISIGITCSYFKGEELFTKSFYAELDDYNINQCDDWIKENVIKNTILGGNKEIKGNYLGELTVGFSPKEILSYHKSILIEKENEELVYVKGNKKYVSEELNKYFEEFIKEKNNLTIQFISDVSHYDFVLLIDLITNGGNAFDLPKYISPVCYDINQDIANYMGISEIEAFDYSREKLLNELHCNVKGVKHNSLYDAKVIREIYLNI